MRRLARQLGKAPVAPVGREGATTRASSSHSMADDEADPSRRQKSILFRKDMVRKIFNVTSGSRAVELLRRNEPHVLREPYRVGSRAPTRRTIEVLEVADVLDVVTIKTAWVLLCIALVLSPGTGNMVPLEYLASLVDMDSINEFAWDEHFLAVALNEVKKYQKKRNEGKTAFWIGGCLPMFALWRLEETPYVRLDSCSEAQHQNNKFVRTDAPTHDIPSNPAFDGCEVGGDVCGSLDEWLHPLPSSEEMEGTMAALQGLALEFDDGPSMSLFKEGTEDFEWLNMDDNTARNPDFIEIEGFHTSLENFDASLKPQAEIDSDIMTLYLKTFNLEQMYNRKKPKKLAFSVFMGSYIPNLRKRIAANLLKHPSNNLDPAEQLRKLLED
ncbi:hypothetical protein ZWY2020_052656 [Hordeum vulgare]|nr:hypothetical protein ZWY2020_052656 [Hordeum vulgare]